jgi:hypothetical protein
VFILQAEAELADYLVAPKQRSHKTLGPVLCQLLRLMREHSRQPLLPAIPQEAHYGLYDLGRAEIMRSCTTCSTIASCWMPVLETTTVMKSHERSWNSY